MAVVLNVSGALDEFGIGCSGRRPLQATKYCRVFRRGQTALRPTSRSSHGEKCRCVSAEQALFLRCEMSFLAPERQTALFVMRSRCRMDTGQWAALARDGPVPNDPQAVIPVAVSLRLQQQIGRPLDHLLGDRGNGSTDAESSKRLLFSELTGCNWHLSQFIRADQVELLAIYLS